MTKKEVKLIHDLIAIMIHYNEAVNSVSLENDKTIMDSIIKELIEEN